MSNNLFDRFMCAERLLADPSVFAGVVGGGDEVVASEVLGDAFDAFRVDPTPARWNAFGRLIFVAGDAGFVGLVRPFGNPWAVARPVGAFPDLEIVEAMEAFTRAEGTRSPAPPPVPDVLVELEALAEAWDVKLRAEFGVGAEYTDWHSEELRALVARVRESGNG